MDVDTRLALLEQADRHHVETLKRLEDGNRLTGESLAKLVVLEERHLETREALGRAFTEIAKLKTDVNDIKLEMPGLKEGRRLLMGGIISIVTLVGLGAYKVIFSDRPTTPAAAVTTTASKP